MRPEQKARVSIDALLQQTGWHVCNVSNANIHAGSGEVKGVAIREFPLNSGFGFADYLLYVNGKACGVIEAKKEGATRMRSMPPLVTEWGSGGAHYQLWPAQISAITNLEKSLAANKPKALIQMATGSGKTFTSIGFIYRLIKFGGARRVLFLVDRGNLARQTKREFDAYASPYNNYKFGEEYIVQHLQGSQIDTSARVVTNPFTPEQQHWLEMIRDHIAANLRLEIDDFEYAPFNAQGGLGKVHQLFGAELPKVIEELNRELAA